MLGPGDESGTRNEDDGEAGGRGWDQETRHNARTGGRGWDQGTRLRQADDAETRGRAWDPRGNLEPGDGGMRRDWDRGMRLGPGDELQRWSGEPGENAERKFVYIR